MVIDKGGTEARRFRVAGSGTTLLYAPTGQLLFSGGVTASRGHEGASVGSEAITRWVLRGSAPTVHAPVFGCALL